MWTSQEIEVRICHFRLVDFDPFCLFFNYGCWLLPWLWLTVAKNILWSNRWPKQKLHINRKPNNWRILTSGRSFMEYTITPWYCGVFSVILPRPDFKMWFPYKNDCSPAGLTQILYYKTRTFTRIITTGCSLSTVPLLFSSNLNQHIRVDYWGKGGWGRGVSANTSPLPPPKADTCKQKLSHSPSHIQTPHFFTSD